MSEMDRWTALGPWQQLKGLVQLCATRSEVELRVAGAELETRLRDGRIPSRIVPSRVRRIIDRGPPAKANAPERASVREGGPITSTSSTWPAPPPSEPGTTSEPTVEGNGGWDEVNWEFGRINSCPIEVHWPSVAGLIEKLRQEHGRTQSGPPIAPLPAVAISQSRLRVFQRNEAKAALAGRKVTGEWSAKPTDKDAEAFIRLQFNGGSRDAIRSLVREIWPGGIKRGPRVKAKAAK